MSRPPSFCQLIKRRLVTEITCENIAVRMYYRLIYRLNINSPLLQQNIKYFKIKPHSNWNYKFLPPFPKGYFLVAHVACCRNSFCQLIKRRRSDATPLTTHCESTTMVKFSGFLVHLYSVENNDSLWQVTLRLSFWYLCCFLNWHLDNFLVSITISRVTWQCKTDAFRAEESIILRITRRLDGIVVKWLGCPRFNLNSIPKVTG